MKIKCRIYDPQKNKMIISGSTPMMLHSFFKTTTILHTKHKIGYQLFTGLLDRFGVEVYEGDILKKYAGKPYETIITVKWNDEQCGFWVCRKNIYHRCLSSDMIEFVEVIGNIYEEKT